MHAVTPTLQSRGCMVALSSLSLDLAVTPTLRSESVLRAWMHFLVRLGYGAAQREAGLQGWAEEGWIRHVGTWALLVSRMQEEVRGGAASDSRE